MSNRTVRRFLPALLIAAGVAGGVILAKNRPEPRRHHHRKRVTPMVSVYEIGGASPSVVISGFGTVRARERVTLVASVAGYLAEKSPLFEQGAVFGAGELLARIDRTDYELAVQVAEAGVARAELEFARAEQEAAAARSEWDRLHPGEDGRGNAAPLVLHDPQLNLARAELVSARARLEQARVNLGRCEIRAPFAGRVISENVDAGQYLSPGAALGVVHSIDGAEVVVPLKDSDLEFFDIPSCRGDADAAAVVIETHFGGRKHRWDGVVSHLSGEIDQTTRMIDLVIRVESPYHTGDDKPPLLDGMFVEASIQGRTIEGGCEIPRAALRSGGIVRVAAKDGTLRLREVSVAFTDRERAIIRTGLAHGELVVTSQLEIVSDGMEIRIEGGGS